MPGGDEYDALGLAGLTEIAEILNEFKTGLNDYLATEAGPLKSGVQDHERRHRLQRAAPRAA